MTRPGKNPAIANARTIVLYSQLLLIILVHTLRRLRFALIALVAVLCLLGVQQGAAFHALSHLADENPIGTQKQLPHSKTCDKCIVYAEASGAGPTTTHAALQVPSGFVLIASATLQLSPSLILPVYSARAPPVSL